MLVKMVRNPFSPPMMPPTLIWKKFQPNSKVCFIDREPIERGETNYID